MVVAEPIDVADSLQQQHLIAAFPLDLGGDRRVAFLQKIGVALESALDTSLPCRLEGLRLVVAISCRSKVLHEHSQIVSLGRELVTLNRSVQLVLCCLDSGDKLLLALGNLCLFVIQAIHEVSSPANAFCYFLQVISIHVLPMQAHDGSIHLPHDVEDIITLSQQNIKRRAEESLVGDAWKSLDGRCFHPGSRNSGCRQRASKDAAEHEEALKRL
mmetsp:Transcript_34217/g.107187  ORF Transcript_34217/g.107187 Transcript_34217/m.107187 type:complete len:215 (-) Transcript_34217:31-675(-)